MRKVFLFMMTTIDGYFEGENHDLSWHNVDAEFNTFANAQLDEADTLIFGRRTYELMADFWPTPKAIKAAPGTAARMNSLKKIVFSHQSFMPAWESTAAYTDIQKLNDIKQKSGKSIAVLGSSDLCVSLLKASLLDEIRVMINPIAIGKGTPLLAGIDTSHKFHLTDSRTFANGN
ncbi:MAG: dihydrofolate reductase family protein, partial [Candidatus Saccharimonadales bacterium]